MAQVQQAVPAPDAQPVPKLHIFPYSRFQALCSARGVCTRQPVGMANCGNSCFASAVRLGQGGVIKG
jgi:hypothetical protein